MRMGGVPGWHLVAERRHLGRLAGCLFNHPVYPWRHRSLIAIAMGCRVWVLGILDRLYLVASVPIEGARGLGRVFPLRPLPCPVLRTDYRLRTIAAGDRARCSLLGEGAG